MSVKMSFLALSTIFNNVSQFYWESARFPTAVNNDGNYWHTKYKTLIFYTKLSFGYAWFIARDREMFEFKYLIVLEER